MHPKIKSPRTRPPRGAIAPTLRLDHYRRARRPVNFIRINPQCFHRSTKITVYSSPTTLPSTLRRTKPIARPTRVIAKHVVAMEAISAPWFAICATSTMEAFTLTAPPRTDLRATLRELVFNDETKRAAHTKSVTPLSHAFTRRKHESISPRNNQPYATRTRGRLGLKRGSNAARTHPITGVAATALDAENRAALCVVNETKRKKHHRQSPQSFEQPSVVPPIFTHPSRGWTPANG